ncbi:hypothetical protein DFH07DRAFT_962665 [Mycena maculata]|uniref:Uncharacterized protein n=1 Tax=Mycena maculata TaxID=230809 RepID=A0AAD7N728_9AGAR|nr:hypothetical protein DFH07DRAFT_962665 [Mycena maculata]
MRKVPACLYKSRAARDPDPSTVISMKLSIAALIPFIAPVVANPTFPREPALAPRAPQVGCPLTYICAGGSQEVLQCEAQGYSCTDPDPPVANATCVHDCSCLIGRECGVVDV